MQFFPSDNQAQIQLDNPSLLDISGGIGLNDRLIMGWSALFMLFNKNSSLDVTFNQQTPHLNNFSISKYRQNSFILGAGASYLTNKYLVLRGGTYYESMSNDDNFFAPLISGLDRFALSAGASFIPVTGLYLDISLMFISGLSREADYLPANFGGTYRSSIIIPGFSVGYGF